MGTSSDNIAKTQTVPAYGVAGSPVTRGDAMDRIVGLTSYHPGGANVAMCDGSVRYLKSSTAYTVMWSLGSRNQGEPLSGDSY